MEQKDLNLAIFVGIDAHGSEHTAFAINRFEEEKGRIQFENNLLGIKKFLAWVPTVSNGHTVFGVEGGGNERHTLLRRLVINYNQVYEVNPLYTKQRRDHGTRGDKSDAVDAKMVAEVVAKKFSELPKITSHEFTAERLALRKMVWYYEEITKQAARIQNQLRQVTKERKLAEAKQERKALDFIIKSKRKDWDRIKKTQKKLTAELEKLLPLQAKNLKTMKGISTILSAKLVAHANGIERFSNLDKFIRYAGIAPLERSSGKTKKYIKANRGNRKLNSAIYMIALSQLCWNEEAKRYVEKKVLEGKTKRHAIRCLMKRMACIVYGMMKSGAPYQGR
ncbi:IS110 family transposase [Candidatus Gottesmanbacteria bacterium]|nr:IS110 family transposase [Candidatus Gottesmanbacteria bacterium]